MIRNYFQRVWCIHADAEAPVTLWARVAEGWEAREVDEFADGGLAWADGGPPAEYIPEGDNGFASGSGHVRGSWTPRPRHRNQVARTSLSATDRAVSRRPATRQTPRMVIGEADRRRNRSPRATDVFGSRAAAALDALALLDLAWHSCYGEPCPPEQVIEDLWLVANGGLAQFVAAAYLAVIDFPDLRMSANEMRN